MNQYYIGDLGWNCLGLHLSKMMGGWKTVKCVCLISSSSPRNPLGKEGNEERERKRVFLEVFNGFVCFFCCLFWQSCICTNFSFHQPVSLLPQIFKLANCWNSSFVVGKHVLLIVLSSGLANSQLQEFSDLVMAYCS